jgi:hypothetical protein
VAEINPKELLIETEDYMFLKYKIKTNTRYVVTEDMTCKQHIMGLKGIYLNITGYVSKFCLPSLSLFYQLSNMCIHLPF